jgi:hypothetical protein
MIIDFFASLLFYITPYLFGRFFIKNIIASWLIGSLLIFASFFALSQIAVFFDLNFSVLMPTFLVGVSITSLIFLIVDIFRKRVSFAIPDLEAILVLVFASLLYFLVWKVNTPYPLVLNWDMYEHITLANLISQGKLSFLTTEISDTFTFNSYSPLFEVLLSIPKVIFQRDLLGIYWWLEYFYYLFTIICSFWIAKKLFKDKLVATISSLISALVFQSFVVYAPLFLIPQTLTALLSIFLIREIKSLKLKFLIPGLVTIFLMHYVVGFVAVAFLGLLYWIYKKGLGRPNLIILDAIAVSMLMVLANFVFKWDILSIEEAEHFNFSLWEKLGFFSDWYGVGLFIPFVIGSIAIVVKRDFDKKIVLIFGLLTLGISLLPFSYFLKFYSLGGYFVNFIIAAGLVFLLGKLSKILKIAGVLWIILFLSFTFYKNQQNYKSSLQYNNLATQLSFQEIEAGKWLGLNSNKNQFLISDPSTQYIIESLSGVNTQGGAFMSLKTRKELISIKDSKKPEEIKKRLLSIKDKLGNTGEEVIFVVGGRYFAWQNLSEKEQKSSYYNIWSPVRITPDDEKFIKTLDKSKQFKMIYRNNEISMFRIL